MRYHPRMASGESKGGAAGTTEAKRPGVGLVDSGRRAPRRRAPRRRGRRTQLTVPAKVWQRAEKLAAETGTTPNDVVVSFAVKGMDLTERQIEVARLAAKRTRAYRSGAGRPSRAPEVPAEDELVEAAGALRRDLAAAGEGE